MPPHVPRKRLRSSSPSIAPPKSKTSNKSRPATSKAGTAPPRKPTLFDDLDATSSPRHNGSKLIHEIQDSEDESSSLSSAASDSDLEFEDVTPRRNKRPKTRQTPEDEDDEDEDIEFEDVETAPQTSVPTDHLNISNDLELTLVRDTRISLTNDALLGKKGPSKLERQIRMSTHCVHVLLLMWHNAIRNAWISDPTVQGIMLSHLTPRLWDEVDRWRRGSGLLAPEEPTYNRIKGKHEPGVSVGVSARSSTRKGKEKAQEESKERDRGRDRDWGKAAQRLEEGAIDRSQGDPLYRLMKALCAWWKQRFRTTAPGLRKWGYMPLERLDRLTKGHKEAQSQESDDPTFSEQYGERIRDLEEFRSLAQQCAGSRDVGAQLFTALLRGLGMEARMVASLQPLGFGWNKVEEADAEDEKDKTKTSSPVKEKKKKKKAPAPANKTAAVAKTSTKASSSSSQRTSRRSTKATTTPTQAADTDSDLQLPSNSDDESIINLSPSSEPESEPTATSASAKMAPKYTKDKDIEFPIYWTEVLSPVTNKYIPVESLVKTVIGTNPDLVVQSLEPRGAKADKAKQTIAYVIGYNPDGTAKDVTVRYLRKKVWPGRTKGFRLPPEKIPVYDKHGRIKRYEQQDWFKGVMMRGYARGFDVRHPITEADTREDEDDLKPAEPAKREPKEGEETLQFYKSSPEFVLERFLKREEALLPTAKVVKYFQPTAKRKTKVATSTANSSDPNRNDSRGEPVYLRKDVVQVKSAETWHKQGRAPKPGELPLKRVPYRAATTNRRREIAEAELATGSKVLQGLYSKEQTDWIIPDPIVDGKIPKNEYGNIDLFVEHMCPAGAVHVPYRGAVRVCKKLGVDFAEAVVDFEFGHRMAVPVIQGVVVAEEVYEQVMEELRRDEEERKRKEDEKRRQKVMAMWRRMIMGLRIVERLKGVYGEVDNGPVGGTGGVFKNKNAGDYGAGETGDMGGGFLPGDDDSGGGGGFIPEGYELEEEHSSQQKTQTTSGFFHPTTLSDEEEDDGEDDTLMIENGDSGTHTRPVAGAEAAEIEEGSEEDEQEPVPSGERKIKVTEKRKTKGKSALSTRPQRKAAAATKKKDKTKAAFGGLRRRRPVQSSSSDDEDEDSSEDQDEEEEDDDEDIYMDSS